MGFFILIIIRQCVPALRLMSQRKLSNSQVSVISADELSILSDWWVNYLSGLLLRSMSITIINI